MREVAVYDHNTIVSFLANVSNIIHPAEVIVGIKLLGGKPLRKKAGVYIAASNLI